MHRDTDHERLAPRHPRHGTGAHDHIGRASERRSAGWSPTHMPLGDAAASLAALERFSPTESLGTGVQTVEERARRALNLAVAALSLPVAAPLMLLIGLLVRVTSRGPALYSQTRIGLDRRSGAARSAGGPRRIDLGGRPFRIYKFRTMYEGPGRTSKQVWTRPNDGRITPVGRLLRAYRLDELPQLVNVIRGDMNVVGPRPEQPDIFRRMRRRLDGYAVRQRVRPGITGLAQVRRGYDSSIHDVERKLAYDLEYVARGSVWLDLVILLQTVPVVLLRKGAR